MMTQQQGRARFQAGDLTFIVQHELWDGNIQDHTDQGVAILVTGEVEGKETTLLRFNCFDVERSYVYGPEGKNKLFRMDHTVDGNPIGWSVKTTIRNSLPVMIEEAGYEDVANRVDAQAVSDALGEVETAARQKFNTDRNTVKHNRGTDIFEAGQYPVWPGDAKVGQRGRRLGDSRCWPTWPARRGSIIPKRPKSWPLTAFGTPPTTTTGPGTRITGFTGTRPLVPNPLDWTLSQFKAKKLRDMIERAGYPGLANDLDQNLIESLLPDMEQRAMDMVAAGLPKEVTPNLNG